MEQQGFCGFPPLRAAGEAGPCISLSITTTTGSPVELTVPRGETEDSLRTRISQKLSLQTDRMVLVHKDRLLTAGKLLDQGVRDGSRLTLVPAIETGLVCLNPKERKIMDMLEGLTETQIDDFLLGRSPLTFSVGSGAHTMCVQLQLSQDVKKLEDSEAQSSCETQTVPSTPDSPDSSRSGSCTPQTSSPSALPTSSPNRPRTSSNSPNSVPPVSCPSSLLPPRFVHPPQPVCAAKPADFIADPHPEADVKAHLSKQPGAVIESFVSHSPGIFSGTFSGTLASCDQIHIRHPRRGISIILQILNDFLRAAYHHQEAPTPPPPSLHHRCTTSKLPVSHFTAKEPCRDRPPQRTGLRGGRRQLLPSSLEENKTLQRKLERLQLLMHQRRLRRQTRRCSHLHKAARPNLHSCS